MINRELNISLADKFQGFSRLKHVVMMSVMLLLLNGCLYKPVDQEHSPYYSVTKGSLLQLHQSVKIPRNQVAVYLQSGQVLRYRDVNKYEPNCKFEIYTMSEDERVVEADVFRIQRVVDEIETVSNESKYQLASLNVGMLLDHSVVFNYASQFYLHSETQPDVYRMTCQHWEDIREDQYLSIAEMRQAMGSVLSLVLK